MSGIEFDPRKFSWSPAGRPAGWFIPNGALHYVGSQKMLSNPENWASDDPVLGARIIVGFSVNDTPRWKLDDLVQLVKARRIEQVNDPGASFLIQRGLYAHRDDPADQEKPEIERRITSLVEEDGAQVIILNVPPAIKPPAEFRQHMSELADELAEKFRQKEVILEFQKGGIHERTSSWGPRTPIGPDE